MVLPRKTRLDIVKKEKKEKEKKESHLRTFGTLILKYLSEESASAKTE